MAVAKARPGPVPSERERERAARVARVMVSELLMYHQGAVEEGLRRRDFFERLGAEIDDVRATYDRQIAEHVRWEQDYVQLAIDKALAERSTPGG